MSEQNKTIVRRFFEETDKGNIVDIVNQLYSEDHAFHQPGVPPLNKEAHKQLLLMYRNVFPDSTQTIRDMLAEGDRVVTRFTFRGTQKAELMGIPPTGKQVEVEAIVINRLADGKIVEEWIVFDSLTMMQQLGIVPAPEQSGS